MVNQRRAGALLAYVYIAVNSLIALVYLPIVKRTLGSSEFGLYELAPGFVLAFVVTVVVSLATKRPSDEIVAEFEKVDAA